MSVVDDVAANATKIHKNSYKYMGDDTIYDIVVKKNLDRFKIGETAVPPNSNGILPRPQSQVNKLNNAAGYDKYKYREIGTFKGKAAARAEERRLIEAEKARDPNSLPGNKSYH